MEQEELTTQADADWDNRVLCSDGRCTGVIGPDGRCRECGALHEGNPGETGAPAGEIKKSADEEKTGSVAHIPVPETNVDEGEGADWDNRVLCSDGNCIGVIGPDGRCKECGLPLKTDDAAAS
ncbi:MAG: hypothetical protein HY742_07000 [Deltaproteobacteria bacterium]|nr:hypothetical protein [Deltaproteobacteria bacterium]